VAGEAGEGDDVADVFHAGGEEDEALEAEAEAGVGDGAVFAQLEVPPVVVSVEAVVFDFLFEDVEPLFALRAADDFADFGDEDVHGGNRFAVIVAPHVERLDAGGVIGYDDRLFAVLFGEVALVLGLEIGAPFDGVFKGLGRFFEEFDGLGVGDVGEGGVEEMLEAGEKAVFDELVEEGEVFSTVVEYVADAEFEVTFGTFHVGCEIGEGHFGLDHPEFGEVAGRMGIFSAEGGAECINIRKSTSNTFSFELAGNSQVSGFAEKVF